MFGHIGAKIEVAETPCYYRLRHALHDQGLEDRVMVGHWEFLSWTHDGRLAGVGAAGPYVQALRLGSDCRATCQAFIRRPEGRIDRNLPAPDGP